MSDDAAPLRVHPSLIIRRSYKGIFSLPVLFGVGGIWRADEDWAKPVEIAALGITTDLRTIAIAALAALIVLRIGASILFAYLNWRRLTYAINDRMLTISSGRLFKRERVIPLQQIQNIEVERGLFDRVFKTALVKVEVASSVADEGTLEALPLAAVARLYAAAGHPLPEALKSSAEEGPPVLLHLGTGRLFVAGLLGWWVAGAALLLPLIEPIFNRATSRDDADQFVERAKAFIAAFSWAETLMLLLAGAALLLLFASLAGVVVNHNFRVTRHGDALRLTKGLVQTKERLIPLDRVRGVSVTEVRLGRISGWYKLDIRLQDNSKDDSSITLAPLARWAELAPLLSALDYVALAEQAFSQSRRSYALVHMFELPMAIVTMLAMPIGLMFVFLPAWFPLAAGAASALFILCTAAEAVRLFTHEHQLTDGRLYLRHGRLLRKTIVVRTSDVQARILRQSFLDRRLGLASVMFDVPGAPALSRIVVPGITLEAATALALQRPAPRASTPFAGSPAALAFV